jgi:hypothetical protein
MTIHPAIPWIFSLVAASAADQADLLRFTNDDQLRGTFRGIKEGPQVVWQHEDLAAPADFKTTRIRHIVLRGGRPLKPPGTLSHIGMVNGDRVPGTVTAMDADSVTLDTAYAGMLRIPRDQMSLLAPNPLGGRIHYHGPFNEEEWKMIDVSHPDGLPAAGEPDPEKPDDKDVSDQPLRWNFTGAAWYWHHKHGGTALVRESGMPERALLRFDLAWKNRLSLAIAFHSDFARPPAKEGDGDNKRQQARVVMDANNLPRLFGNSYVLQLYNNYLTLMKTKVDAEGNFSFERDHRNNSGVRLGDTGRATIELRCNRRSGEITLFVNDEFAAQWSGLETGPDEPPEKITDALKGSGFGFSVQGVDSPVRISDIIVSEWNGMPDSARSLQTDDLDVVLMSNGTDRYAGSVNGLDEQGKILFEGKHGRFQFPLEDVAEIRFARDRQAAASDPAENNMVVRMGPMGVISGQPLAGDAGTLGILNPVIGELNVSTEHVSMIDFNASSQPIHDWNSDF